MPLDDTGFGRRIEALEKMDRVIDLLATEDRWCKQQLVSPDGRRCILGAVQAVDGVKLLAYPIQLAIRQVTGREFGRIERFNDDRSTTHALVVTVLRQARANIIDGSEEFALVGAPAAPASWWSAPLKRLTGRFAAH
jgi:hypothetical protein